MAHSTAGVFDIPPTPGNDVYVEVKYGLAGCFAAVDPDIEAVNRALGLDGMAGNIDALISAALSS